MTQLEENTGLMLRRMSPGTRMRVVTPSDDDVDNLPPNSTLYVQSGGDIVVLPKDNEDGDTVTINVPDGFFMSDVIVRRVLDAGTTASGIYAIW